MRSRIRYWYLGIALALMVFGWLNSLALVVIIGGVWLLGMLVVGLSRMIMFESFSELSNGTRIAAEQMEDLLPSTRRLHAGLCPRCGYDLRATPNRCPECGHQLTEFEQREIQGACAGRTTPPATSGDGEP